MYFNRVEKIEGLLSKLLRATFLKRGKKMFTGIIEDIGVVHSVKKGKEYGISIRSEKIVEDVHLGDSISVNGVCLTVTSFTKSIFTVDVMPETVKSSSIQTFKFRITCEFRDEP